MKANRTLRSILLAAIAMTFPTTGAVAEDAPAGSLAGSRPNVLVMLCDDLGYGDLACQGHPVIRSPNLDRLAEEGVRLTSCYASAPVCSSSRAGLMTGRTPGRNGVYDWIPNRHVMHLPADEITVATLLQQAGYDTGHFGKWHLNGKFNTDKQPQPGDHGFDYWFSTQNNASPTHHNPKNFARNGKWVGPLKGYSCQLVADEAIGWLDSRGQTKAPFFAYVCFHETHEQVESPPELVASYLDDEGPRAKNENQAQYFASATNMDRAVGRLLEALEKRKLAKSTLVIFTSDNGPETLDRYRSAIHCYGSPGPFRGMKLWLYEGGIRVPGIVRWPGVVEAGGVSDVPVCGVDLLPTLCELAGCVVPKDRALDGTSLVPLLAGERLDRRKPLYWSYVNALGKPKAAMRIGDYMILGARVGHEAEGEPNWGNINPFTMAVIKTERLGDFELYNLAEDIGQADNLAESQPDRLEKYARMLVERHRKVVADGPTWEFPEE